LYNRIWLTPGRIDLCLANTDSRMHTGGQSGNIMGRMEEKNW